MLAVTGYQVALAFHIFAAVVWVGGALTLQLMATLALQSKLPGRMAEYAGEAQIIELRVYLPASLVLLALGFYLVYEGDWRYSLWVVLGLAGIGLSIVTGIAYLTPQAERSSSCWKPKARNRPRRSSGSGRRCSRRGSSL